ncbi:MAG: autotransporter outer membrane beta-barrel domain-containing protein, partial [Desulfovibrionaceae bacterium]
VSGTAFMAGLAKTWQGSVADFLVGAFFEATVGNYKASSDFGSASVDGKGDNRALGGGILARMDMTDTAFKGLYAEASFRLGDLTNNYRSNDVHDFTGKNASYDNQNTYYGAHVGIGYLFDFTDKANLDLYGKYFWTHQTGQDVTILGDEFQFKDMDSYKLKMGGRFSYAVAESLAPYIGAAWEHEFDGKAKATTYGFDVPAPSLKDDTGVGEIGLSWKPANAQGFSVDLGAQGYIGQREGISGTLQCKYEF